MNLLRALATRREPTEPVLSRYDPSRCVAEVHEDGRWVSSWLSRTIPETKKADLETGEDQKGT